ncbi:MAG: hypothetical protein FD161_2974 [Limisphaerales bacterium]|nr:MAG: hypothetical protein FD161_2974 [Limisphaerales bacterium]KAG0508087.1 MAG: hypothetical protein E1N63_2681 [Limisphaerales bacterium]TXT53060.1 MAG: hypothetical protein FD140_168 [Limisphaerales bacterium]
MDPHAYLAARFSVSGPPVLGRPLPPVRFGHVELLARVRSPFANVITGDAYREPQAGDLFRALEIVTHAPHYLPSAARLHWLRFRHRKLTEGGRLAACNTLAAHVLAALALPRFWSKAEGDDSGDSGCPWLLSLATCQMKLLGVREELLAQKPMQLVIQQCFAAWADERRLHLVSADDEALRARNLAQRAATAAGQRLDVDAIVKNLQRLNAGRR